MPSLKIDHHHTKSSESPPSNLSEFARNSQEKQSSDTPKFAIPNIFGVKPKANPIIDLKLALLSDSEKKELPKEVKIEKKDEEFIPKFIECDLKTSNPAALGDNENVVICSSTLKDLIPETASIHQPSMMGKIIGKHYKKRVPYTIRHTYEPLKDINRFRFDVPSPDDQILVHLLKK